MREVPGSIPGQPQIGLIFALPLRCDRDVDDAQGFLFWQNCIVSLLLMAPRGCPSSFGILTCRLLHLMCSRPNSLLPMLVVIIHRPIHYTHQPLPPSTPPHPSYSPPTLECDVPGRLPGRLPPSRLSFPPLVLNRLLTLLSRDMTSPSFFFLASSSSS